ncbi:hypothetical protein P7G51_07865 [Enterococcus asini]|uniref:hypothetical protein n=1 Tax=Enterococcus asini TaxID=57732 RepID=UPI00288F888E|nr:hypothetical protein [Enterococcus asini]MDT2757294.1 hypothetical protein [Enterococcus asini]
MTAGHAIYLNILFTLIPFIAIIFALVLGFKILKQLTVIATELKKMNKTKSEDEVPR